jgi:MFS family permease
MSHAPHRIEQDPETAKANPDRFRVGTLFYTKSGLTLLFLWLLWGDFCFTLMEIVVPSVLPIKLNALGASNWLLGLIVVTVPNVMNTVLNPVASFRSDRFRSRWGRRIPFLAAASPLLVFFLVLLGFGEPIGAWLQAGVLGGRFSRTAVVLAVIGVLMVGFQFFNLIVNAVYWYLFNDVVPHAYLARFMALFRMVGSAAGSLYSYFVFKYAGTHMSWIFAGAGALYFLAFLLMCWQVKEGEYPPPPVNVDGRQGILSAARTYAVECFTHRFYWYFFLANTCAAMTWVTGTYRVFQMRSIGIDLETLGKVGGIAGIVGTVLLYPAGVIADRYHPLRVLIGAAMAGLLVAPVWLIFIGHDFSHPTTLGIFIGLSAVGVPAGTLYGASELPMYMKLLPQDRYGQFCSANAMVRSVAIIASGVLCGAFMDGMARVYPAKDYCYRFLPLWSIFFHTASIVFLLLLYREWKRLGGLHGYRPPGVAAPTPSR